eukprot:gene1273-11360_t
MTEKKFQKIRKIDEIETKERIFKKLKLENKDSFVSVDEEYFSNLKSKEKISLLDSLINFEDSKNLEKLTYVSTDRIKIVEWLDEVREYFSLSILTLHLAVLYLDKIVYKHSISQNMFQVLAAVCFFIALKKEESPELIPSVEQMIEVTENDCSKEYFNKMELFVLNALEWKLSAVSPFDFLKLFLPLCLSDEENSTVNKKAIRKIEDLSNKFIKIWLFCPKLHSLFQPSIIASASIAVSKKILGFTNIWTEDLEILSEYKEQDLKACMDRLSSVYHDDEFCHYFI